MEPEDPSSLNDGMEQEGGQTSPKAEPELRNQKRTFPGLSADAFVSDADKWALNKLQSVPLMPQLVAKFYEIGIDRWLYCYNMGMAVRCGPRQYPSLYNILRESCQILDMAEPELYVTNNPFPNAFAGGVERPYITLRSSIIDNLSDEGLYHLIGHELGHIKAKHVLYFSVASLLVPLLDLLGRRTMGASDVASYALVLALYEWSRQAEFSADRAGLLVSQSIDSSLQAQLALTAGPSRFRHELSLDAFKEQARIYQEADRLDQIGKAVLFTLIGKTLTHPMPIHRAQALERWYLSGGYERVMKGDYRQAAS
jgi:Zn-dependent protease with chaperone function